MDRYILFLFLLSLFAGCDGGFDMQDEDSSQIVVEGWIEEDGFPIVMLTRPLVVSTDYQSMDDLSDYIIRWAKITVNDGTESVVLTGKYDSGYFPPYIYTTSRMKGEAGKQYSLTVEYRDSYATAVTTIPSGPYQCDFKVERCDGSDTLFQIKAIVKDNPTEKDYYQFFTRVGTSTKQFQASYLGTFDDSVIDSVAEIPIYRGRELKEYNYIPYFLLSDTISVKIAHIDQASFRFWDSYTKTLSLSNNMFFSNSTDIETNLTVGQGYWCGYNSITSHIVIQDSIK